MQARAALLWEQPGKWDIATVELDEPRSGEVLVEMASAGLCHSDDHWASGAVPFGNLPLCGGHEGAGVVRQVGPNVTGLEIGDHVVTIFIPSCGFCRWCVSGMQNLCDFGAELRIGAQKDGTFRMHTGGKPIGKMQGTFAEWQVYDQTACVKIPKDIPLHVACLVACGVPTGWGAAVHGIPTQPGDVIIVMGVGGVGINAIQGAANCTAAHVIAVDPVAFKREVALQLGATEAFADFATAADFARSVTNGQGADGVIITVGVIEGRLVADAFSAIRKAGTVAVVSQGSIQTQAVEINLLELSVYQKRIQGVLYGMGSPRREVPRLLDLYKAGKLHLDELVTRRYSIDQLNEAYADMHNGLNIRGVIDLTTR